MVARYESKVRRTSFNLNDKDVRRAVEKYIREEARDLEGMIFTGFTVTNHGGDDGVGIYVTFEGELNDKSS